MNLKNILFYAFATFACCASADRLSAIELDSYVDMTGGYQNHNFRTHIDVYDPSGALILVDNLSVRGLKTWTVGAEGRYCLPCWDGLYLRSSLHYGSSFSHPRYEERITAPSIGVSQIIGGGHHGYTLDAKIGVGYLFNLMEVGVAPVAGWSYNYQKLKMRELDQDGVPNAALEGLRNSYRWEGPFIGIDLFYDTFYTCCWGCLSLETGYEYHWANFCSEWKLNGANVTGGDFSDVRKSRHAHGQLGYFEARWNFNPCWNMGFTFTYQYWTAEKGTVNPLSGSFASINPTIGYEKLTHVNWQSISISYDIGINF